MMLCAGKSQVSCVRQQAKSRQALCLQPRISRCNVIVASNDKDSSTAVKEESTNTASTSAPDVSKELNKFTRTTAATFAPRSSTKSKNPAVKGSVLYNIFEVQAWLSLGVGGLLAFNVLYPSDQPDIARLLGMWSIWMFTIPSLRAKECTPREKDALNILFVAMPLMNILLPFIWKSFPFIFVADTIMLLGIYYQKGVWQEVYGLPFMAPGALDTPLPGTAGAAAGEGSMDGAQE